MATIIALYGPQQVGKSTAALSLVEHHEFTRIAFADPIYRMVAALLNISMEAVRRLPKNEPMEALGGQTLRYALQTLGTEWGREKISQDLWISTARRSILDHAVPGRPVVIDDLRFDNEYAMLAEIGCLFVRLRRDGVPEQDNPGHASETAWAHFQSHAEVTNPPDGAANWARKAGEAILDALRVA
jgi:hypothetical protein